MDLLNRLTIKNLKLNKKRTIVTIIGIMLSVALITAVATMYSSAIKSLIKYETYHKGNFHVAFYDVNEKDLSTIRNNKGVDKIYITTNIGYAKLDESKNEYKPYAYVKGFTKDSLENLSVKLLDGRLPQNENEVLIPNHLKTNGRVDFKVGDTVTLEVGTRVSDDYELDQSNPYNNENGEKIINTTEKTYKIVGVMERPADNIESYSAPGYTFITYLDENQISGDVDVYARYNHFGSKNYSKVTSDILGIREVAMTYETEEEYDSVKEELDKAKYKYNVNSYLIALENNPMKENTMGGLGAAVGVVLFIIVLTSVICIKNSFDISITEKIKQYGMLRSVGATKKQIKRNVFFEGTVLGLIGIPLGLLLGFFASILLVFLSNSFLKEMIAGDLTLVVGFSWKAVLLACVLGIITIYLSALRSAGKAAKVSPITSIRNSAEIKIKSPKLKTPFLIKKMFGIGGVISHKNFRRNKKKYRTTILSIVVSVSIFIGLSYFIDGVFSAIDKEITRYNYNVSAFLSLDRENEEAVHKLLSTTTLDHIDDYAVKRDGQLYLYDAKYTDHYMKLQNSEREAGQEAFERDSYIFVITVGDFQFRKYLKELNLDYNEFQDKAILYSDNDKYDYKEGDVIKVREEESNTENAVTIGNITHKKPLGNYQDDTFLFVSDKLFDKIVPKSSRSVTIYYQSGNPNKLQDEIEEVMGDENFNLQNIDENARMMNNLYTLVAIFLYGFIIVISLIGITNIFNTITTNMNLRKQEFAMLKSVGMTTKEFRKMIRLESVFIGAGSLIYGIPIGTGISYLIYHVMEESEGLVFKLPIFAIIISIVVVYLLITILMKYSMSKINKENTIETIRNENI